MITVKATREGLLGGKTSTGYLVDATVPFVALPSTAALRQWVRVRNPKTGKSIRALVLDVGPWNEHDQAYVFQGHTLGDVIVPDFAAIRPAAESGTDTRGRKTNGAGIDLGERVWQALGMVDNGDVEWEFV
jgi:hypothetical protein